MLESVEVGGFPQDVWELSGVEVEVCVFVRGEDDRDS